MQGNSIEVIYQTQKSYFQQNHTKDIAFRKQQLRKLKQLIEEYEPKIIEALDKDLKKPAYESLMLEIGPMYADIQFILSRLSRWAKPKRVPTPLFHFPGSSHIYKEPYGQVLVIAPWNYPFNLSIAPIVGAIAAGNTVVLKPSEAAPHVSKVLAEMINSNFDKGLVYVIEGAVEETKQLLNLRWDYIFFTGGTGIGKIVYKAAAENLTPVTLELGGKNPCVVTSSANLDMAAKRIAWSKIVNCGQTCLAPDYLFIHSSVYDAFLEKLKQSLEKGLGENALESQEWGAIINENHFNRLIGYLQEGKIIYGGKYDAEKLRIEPTLITELKTTDKMAKEEIFGPILPIYRYNNLQEVTDFVKQDEKPLASYIFTSNSTDKKQFLEQVSSGGGAVNETILHIGTSYLPFGGVGASGMGAYHGKASFDTFTHHKSIMNRGFNLMDDMFRHPPYNNKLYNNMKMLMKRFL